MKKLSVLHSTSLVVIPVLCMLSWIFLSTPASSSPPEYGSGQPTAEKIRYCQMLVRRFGHYSQRINADYYGVGVSRPNSNDWSLRTKEPGWFSSDLSIIFEQRTEERYRDFTHRLVCHWNEDNFFTLTILHHDFGPTVFCTWSEFIFHENDCP